MRPLPHPLRCRQRTGVVSLVAAQVADMDKAIAYLAGKGVAVTWGPVLLGKSKRAEIQDPDGLPIELRQW